MLLEAIIARLVRATVSEVLSSLEFGQTLARHIDEAHNLSVPTSHQAGRTAYTIKEVVERVGVSRTLLHQEIKAGRLAPVRIGRRALVTASALDAWLSGKAGAELEQELCGQSGEERT